MEDINTKILEELKAIRKLMVEAVTRDQFNAVIALLLTLVGKSGREEVVKNHRASKKLVAYFGKSVGLQGRDLGAILNTTASGISNLKAKKRKEKK